MFSELKHNPRFQLQLKQSDVVPSHVSQDWPGKSNFQREAIILEKLLVLFFLYYLIIFYSLDHLFYKEKQEIIIF